jgi:alpha-beta hydrolase superfamily lysophospholipase
MWKLARNALTWFVAGVLSVVLVFATVRAIGTLDGPPLLPWHTYVPSELDADELDATDWAGYLAAEQRLFDAVRADVWESLPPALQVPNNRFYPGSPLNPGRFAHDWNRSYVLEPEGAPRGVVVLLHGLTDAPYSLRNVAARYRDRGFVAIGLRLPGHGTVPGGLTRVRWEDWQAAARLALREARRRVPAPAPLHVVGYSNGGALAMKLALDAAEHPEFTRADRLILLTPMIGVTRFARFAGLAGLPALLPAFAKAAWLGIVPEFNPYKYNSFPVNAARQSYLVTAELQDQLRRLARRGGLAGLPPILTFQSVVDATVSAPAILDTLYANLPDNGSEVVLFDVNRAEKAAPLLREASRSAAESMTPTAPRTYRFTVLANSEGDPTVFERSMAPGQLRFERRPLNLAYPADVFSLSHISLPFPMDDPLYGLVPNEATRDESGVNLGVLSARGERGVLVVDQDFLTRLSANPFFPYVLDRVDDAILSPSGPTGRALPATGADAASEARTATAEHGARRMPREDTADLHAGP